MAKVLIAYFSSTGTTEKMAQYIAEGVRIAGHEAEARKVSEFKSESDVEGYDGYVFGCPMYHLDMPGSFKTFLSLLRKADLQGKAGGAFSSRTHPSSEQRSAAAAILLIMEGEFKMKITDLGPFDLESKVMDTVESMRACQDYGKSVGAMLGTL
ncbi:MAG: Flavodoxin [Syntrophorhabdaceae bacterium PtaU1.Bin034]|nr:MAG: Flavodoxin [Syntrophorhabdaceae bacterium PtaU1.Bin034]